MLKVLNINKFIKDNNILEVSNRNSFDREGNPTNDGLYSNIIFGTTSDEMGKIFGYINLNGNVLHPSIFNSLSKLSTVFKKIVFNEKKYILQLGELIEDEKGNSGLGWLFNNWTKIDFSKFAKDNNSAMVEFITNTPRNELFVSKYIVVPPKFRMYTEEHGRTIEDELTMLYKNVLSLTNVGQLETGLMQAVLKNSNKDLEIQKAVNTLYDYFLQKLEKKEGQFRSTLISKRIDNNVRLVANARPDIPFNCAGLPWHVLLNVFDAFIIGSLNKNIFSKDFAKELGISSFSPSKLGTHFDYIFRNVDTYTNANPGKRELWVQLLKEMFEWHPELKVLLKRDPAWDSGSYHALFPIIIPTNAFHIVVNSLLYKPLGGDSFNSNNIVFEKDNVIISNDKGTLSTQSDSSYYLKSLNYYYKEI